MTRARAMRSLCSAFLAAIILCSCGLPRTEHAAGNLPGERPRGVAVTRVDSRLLSRKTRLPADLIAFRDVLIYPKVQGFVEWIGVDRGSRVRKGDLLIRMSAPELLTQTKQNAAEARAALEDAGQVEQEVSVTAQQLAAARAKAGASTDTYRRLHEAASSYAGIIAGNDLEIAQKRAEADMADVGAYERKLNSIKDRAASFKSRQNAAVQAENSSRDIQSYLTIRAAFDGVITERNVHEGSFVHPPAADTNAIPLLRLQQLSVLRLVVPVPETDISGVTDGAAVSFTVPSYPGESFTGIVRRIAEAVEPHTRTMAVEMDVANASGRLAPGMFAEVIWPVRRSKPTLVVPQSAVVKTTERTFVIRVNNGMAEWVEVQPGLSVDGLVEVVGSLREGDRVVVRATDELRPGTRISVREGGA